MDPIAQELITQCVNQFEENTRRIVQCCGLVTDEEIWKRPNKSSNSIGNLILHLCGNVGQYVLASLGCHSDSRERDKEFRATDGPTKKQLLEQLQQTMKQATLVMNKLSDKELMRTRSVQGFNQTGVHILIHVTEHYSYHTGQIAFWVKQLKDTDLGFYAGIDLNVLNKD